jgi:hypothetical protein
MARKKKMDVGSMGNNEILELFENKFKSEIVDKHGIFEPEIEIERGLGSNSVKILCRMYGMAGSPSFETYNDIDGVEKITIERFDKGQLSFKLDKEETVSVGGNEYLVTYRSN